MNKWLQAFRLRTLPLAFSCILFGSFMVYNHQPFSFLVVGLALLTTLFLQVLSNLANDYGDFEKGTDNENRVGPKRTLQSGMIKPKEMKIAIAVFITASLVSGVTLLWVAFGKYRLFELLVFLAIGISAILAALLYTIGKKPYGYRAMGDVFVFIFFGLVGVLGSGFLQTANLSLNHLFPAFTVGLLSMAVLNMNNTRDMKADESVGKITIPVIIGYKRAKIYQLLLVLGGLISATIFGFNHFGFTWKLGFLLPGIFLISHLNTLLKTKNNQALDPELKKIALSTFALSVLFTIFKIIP